MRHERLLATEARERSRLLRMSSYDGEMDLRPLADESWFSSRTTVRFDCLVPGANTFLDLTARHVTRATLNGRDLPLDEVVQPTRLVLPALADTNEFVVEATFDAVGSAEGLHKAVDPSDGLAYAWTTFEPFGAHLVFGCFDQPDLRAPFRFTVTVPDSWRAISNNPVDVVDGNRWSFTTTPPLPTYLTVVCAGPYAEQLASHGDLPIGFYCRQSFAPHLDVDNLLDLTRRGLDHFTETFGTPYPFAKLDHVFCPEMNGAMENAGCITYTDQVVFRAPPPPSLWQWRRYVVMHEMAHMWFGDLVTPVWWDDLWLKESFADWASWDALTRACGDEHAWADFMVGSKQTAYVLDAGSTTHPVSADVDDVVAGVGRFDAISYQKGASLLKQLAALVGEKALEAGLAEYFRRHAWGNTRLTDLLDALGTYTDVDLDAWADAWVRATGYPRLRMEIEGKDRIEAAALRQESLTGESAAFPLLVGIGVYDLGGNGRLRRRERVDVQSSSPVTNVAELTGRHPAALLLVNDDDLAYAGTRLDDESLDTMLRAAHTLVSPVSRGLCACLAWDMVRAGELAVEDHVLLVARMAPSEPSAYGLESFAAQARAAACWYTDAGDTGRLLTLLGDGLLAAITAFDETDPRRRPAQLALCSVAMSDAQLREVRRLQADSSLDANLRWAALLRLVALGEARAAEIDALRLADPDPDVGLRVLAAEAAIPDASTKEKVWRHVFDHDVPATASAEIGAAFWQPGQAAVITPYAERWLAEITRINSSEDWYTALGRARRMAPELGVDDGYVAQLRRLAEAFQPTVAKTVNEIADERARRLHARRSSPASLGGRA
jgi:aminopeptidase N